jgi:hypothetical protein
MNEFTVYISSFSKLIWILVWKTITVLVSKLPFDAPNMNPSSQMTHYTHSSLNDWFWNYPDRRHKTILLHLLNCLFRKIISLKHHLRSSVFSLAHYRFLQLILVLFSSSGLLESKIFLSFYLDALLKSTWFFRLAAIIILGTCTVWAPVSLTLYS